jgi:hypothetical protein
MTTNEMKEMIELMTELEVGAVDVNDQVMAQTPNLEKKDGVLLMSICGRGGTDEEAVQDLFQQMTEASLLIHNAWGADRRAFSWDGGKFVRVQELVA